jgi:hypothetical protein
MPDIMPDIIDELLGRGLINIYDLAFEPLEVRCAWCGPQTVWTAVPSHPDTPDKHVIFFLSTE